MEQDTQTATPPADATATQNGAEAVANGNGNAGGDANGQGAPDQVNFIPDGADLESLPTQVRDLVKSRIDKINKDMVRGFTEKTMKLSERIKAEAAKATEPYKSKAEFYDQFTKDEKLVAMYNDYVRQMQTAADSGNSTSKIEEKVHQLETQIKSREMVEVIDAFVNATDEKGQKVNGDFEKVDKLLIGEANINGQPSKYSLLRAAVELASGNTPQEKLTNGYKAAKAAYDAIYQEGIKAGKGQMQRKAGFGSLPPSGGKSQGMAPRAPKNALEALQFAREGLAVHHE